MPSDAASSDENELLNQIDELKARMDRLMSGGSSTSNSALLTEKPEAKPPTPPTPPEPDRTRVRDLVETDDTEVIEVYPGPKEVVPFPKKDKGSAGGSETVPAAESDPVAPNPSSGSVISVEEEQREERPQVATFDDLGSAIQHELARDVSIPPAEARKGPDLASRFGPADAPAAEEKAVLAAEEQDLAEPDEEVEPIVEAEVADDEDDVDYDDYEDESGDRSAFGKVAAVWALTAVASGAIAVLHFVGII